MSTGTEKGGAAKPYPGGPSLARGAGTGSVSFDPEADGVAGMTRDRDSHSENRCSSCSAIHISARISLVNADL